MASLLAADTTSLAAATALKVHLATAAFTPAPTLIPGNFTEATFAGYAALLAGVGNAQVFFDPATGNKVIQLLEPAGGWHWATSSAVGLPQTVFGYYVTDNASAVVWGSGLITPNVVLTATAQGVDVPQMRFTLPPIPLS
jgi:hypothetical protein